VRSASVIVRAKNQRDLLEQALRSLHAQTIRPEIIVVDSGSTDGALDVAHAHADRVVEIAPQDFSYGGALNQGARAATGDIHFALSSHCRAERPDWIERALAHYADDRVAGTHGCRQLPDRRPLTTTFLQDADHARRHPYWGFSNHASSWRAQVWADHPFDETLDACEDKAWAWSVMDDGWLIAVDPELDITKKHRTRAGVRALYERSEREAHALATVMPLPPRGPASAVKAWWEVPQDGRPALRHRLNYFRMVEAAGRWAGERRARRSVPAR
jgi:rhamnosyltransferase